MTTGRRCRARGRAGCRCCALLVAYGEHSSPPLEIRTVNNRADLVSGGDAMVEIVLPEGADTAGLKVDVAGRDVSSAFARASDGRVTGVITGLAKGDNVVQARADKAGAAQLTITNAGSRRPGAVGRAGHALHLRHAHAAGRQRRDARHQRERPDHRRTDATCNIATEYKLYYRSNDGRLQRSPARPEPERAFTSTRRHHRPRCRRTPASSPTTRRRRAGRHGDARTTDAGATVPFIVRVERGTMNRGIYDMVVLYDPTKPWAATAPQAAVERQDLLRVRRQHRPAAPPDAPATAWTRETAGAVTRLHGGREQHDRLGAQLEPRA